MEAKRIVFTNENPNSHGIIVRDNTIDFSRYNINPIILGNHDWKSLPIGRMTDIRKESVGYSGIPQFHGITEESKVYQQLYEQGWLSTSSIGGMMTFRKDLKGKQVKDDKGNVIATLNEQGYMETEYVDLYEISLPAIPSNPTAATEEALAQTFDCVNYQNEEIENITGKLVTLSSELETLNLVTMAKKKEDEAVVEQVAEVQAEKSAEETATTKPPKVRAVRLSGAFDMIRDLISLAKVTLQHPEGEYGDMPIEQEPEKAVEKSSVEMAEKESVEVEVEIDKKEEEKVEETEACKNEVTASVAEPVEVVNEVKQEEVTLSVADSQKEVKMSEIPQMKSAEELTNLNLAAAPDNKINFKPGVTFTQLSADKGEGEQIIARVLSANKEGKQINDYSVVLNALMADPKYKPFIENTRFHLNANMEDMESTRSTLDKVDRKHSFGVSFKEVAERLNQGVVLGIDWKAGNKDARRTTFSTDSAFSSLDTTAVEWLPTVIFALFPKRSWREDIPVFSIYNTERNLGIIWTQIAANAAVYRGTVSIPVAHYTYSDTAVGLKLVPYWLQPTRWTPLDMHLKRYDMFSTGMEQNLRNMNAKIDDDLLYTLGAGALANSRILYTGGPIDSTQPSNFTIGSGGNGVDAFYFNSAFSGSLLKPGFNDIMKIEQAFSYQNFDLEQEKTVLIGDSITYSYLKQDKATQSMLTRWINENGSDVQKISHTKLHERSRVVAYDPTGGTIIDTNAAGAVIPATTQSANLAIVPSQVGIGLGMIDVFFVQDPANYGFVHSMNMRTGIRGLRSDYKGVTLYAYSNGAQAGS